MLRAGFSLVCESTSDERFDKHKGGEPAGSSLFQYLGCDFRPMRRCHAKNKGVPAGRTTGTLLV